MVRPASAATERKEDRASLPKEQRDKPGRSVLTGLNRFIVPTGPRAPVRIAACAAFAALAALAATVSLAAASAPPPAALPAGVSKVVSVEGVDEYRLANGLEVLLYPDASKPTATVNVTYKVGSRMENYGETGMAHLLEHLMFKGSKHFPEPDKEFSARGFRNNGTTYFDRTNYFSTFQASDDNLRWALAQQADAMTNSFIARKDLDSEMTVVRNEYEMGETRPSSVLFKRLHAAMYDWHNYGKETIGNRSDIENVDIAHLQAFYRLYYQPDNAVLIVAGSFDEAKTLRWIAADFGVIPRPKRTLPKLWTVEPVQDGERSIIVRRKGDSQLVLVGYHIPAERSTDGAALGVAAEILGGTPNGRLHHELVESGLAAEVFVEDESLFDPGTMVFGARVKPGDSIERARDRLIEVVESSFAHKGPTEEEMTRVRRDSETGAERSLADPQEFGIALSESIAQGDWRLFFIDRDLTAKATAEQVGAAAQRYFRRDNRTVAMFIPEDHPQRAEIPAPLPMETMLADFTPRTVVAAGESFEPTQENIDKRTELAKIGDLKLALLPKKTKGETVNVAMDFRFGDEKSLFGKAMVRDLTAAMIGRGSDKLTRQQIADEMTRLKMTGDLFDFQASRATVVDALRLSAAVVRGANFPASEFDQLKRELLTGLQAKLSDPGEISRDALQKHFDTYPPGDPRHYQSLKERIDAVNAVTLADVKAFYEQFWGTSRGEIAVVGDFDAGTVKEAIAAGFAPWHSKAPYADILREPHAVTPDRIFVDTPEKENAVYRARLALDLRDDDPDAPALMLANEIIGGGSGLHNRLVDRVRQKDGLSYGIGSGLLVNGKDRAAAWAIGAIAAPQNIDKVEAEVREELERLRKDGFGKDEVEEARRGVLQERMLARSDDATLAAGWVNNLDLGRTFTFSRQLEDRVRALTPEQMTEAVRRYLDPAKLTVVIAGDASKGAK
jgi:zinc protease